MDNEKQKKQQDRSLIAGITDSFPILLFVLFLFLALLIPILIFVGGYYTGYSTEHKISNANEDRALLAEDQRLAFNTENLNLKKKIKTFKERTETQIFTVGIENHIRYFGGSNVNIESERILDGELKIWALIYGKEEIVKIPPVSDK